MRVVFEDYWRDVREGLAKIGVDIPPADLEQFIDELRGQQVSEVRLCARWLHVMDVEASGGALPAVDALARSPFMHYGTYLLIGGRAPDGTIYEFRQRHYPEEGQPHEVMAHLRARLENAGFQVLAGRWQY